jgi:hypothetical protein
MQELSNGQLVFSQGEPLIRMFANGSANDMTPGVCVKILQTVSSGTAVDFPGAEADPLVMGVVYGNTDNTVTYPTDTLLPVVLEGPAKCKVNGTDNISVGDPVMARATTGIAYKDANSISCAFGTALEAYTDNDDLGWITVYVKKAQLV